MTQTPSPSGRDPRSARHRSRVTATALAVTAILGTAALSPSAHAAAAKAGGKCPKVNAKSGALVCVSKGGKLVWARTSTATTAAPTTAPRATTAPAATGTDVKPFKIGFTNMDTGGTPQPGVTDGAQAAVQYLNKSGGVKGRPIELVMCSAANSNESTQECGQKFANDKSLNMAVTGISLNAGPFYAALANSGLPVQGFSPVTPADYTAPSNVTWTYSGGAGTYVGLAKIADFIPTKNIAFLQLDSAGGQAGLADFKALVEPKGMVVKSVAVSQTATDLLAPLTAVDAVNAGAADRRRRSER